MTQTTLSGANLVQRRFTSPGTDVYDSVRWQRTDALIPGLERPVFEQQGVEFPVGWSENAVNIVAQKYFRGPLGGPNREWSLRQLVDRVCDTITQRGEEAGYFAGPEEVEAFRAELKYLVLTQRMAFNSPVWFNIGVPDVPQQASACFILDVEDDMQAILRWYQQEGTIFSGGSGAGVNLSKLRGSMEHIKGGGIASGPVSFMRGADSVAGTIKSGGKTRRAAKMCILDVDHPDIEEFVWCKAREERKIRALKAAGFDMDMDGVDSHSVQFQNANNSVRLTDDFMRAVEADEDWQLVGRTDGRVIRTLPARALFAQLVQAAWECADPGVQFHDTVNRWHTQPAQGPITGSNPCSEYMSLPDTACNLASLNLVKFLHSDDGSTWFDGEDFRHAVHVTVIAQDILVGLADYPTEPIARNARAYRQLGVGYANLGALLMIKGHSYDSAEGRHLASAITSLMTAQAYLTSAQLAGVLGPFEGCDANVGQVIALHREAAERCLDDSADSSGLQRRSMGLWAQAADAFVQHGVRNSQLSLLAPTGTISFFMDCDTTGGEPCYELVAYKTLVGGGTMTLVAGCVERALVELGYAPHTVTEILAYVATHGYVHGCELLKPTHEEIFACAAGPGALTPLSHVQMMAAMQPFLSGAISKTVNMAEESTQEDLSALLMYAWHAGIKALAVYRDKCKSFQPLSSSKGTDLLDLAMPTAQVPAREELPRERPARVIRADIGEHKAYVTVGEYPDGRLGEVFVTMSKQGSTLSGLVDAHATTLSIALQHGVPLEALARPMIGTQFEPRGMTNDPEVRTTTSLWDYIARKLMLCYGEAGQRQELGVFTRDEYAEPEPQAHAQLAHGRMCTDCGSPMVRTGGCFGCRTCGTTSGCS